MGCEDAEGRGRKDASGEGGEVWEASRGAVSGAVVGGEETANGLGGRPRPGQTAPGQGGSEHHEVAHLRTDPPILLL